MIFSIIYFILGFNVKVKVANTGKFDAQIVFRFKGKLVPKKL